VGLEDAPNSTAPNSTERLIRSPIFSERSILNEPASPRKGQTFNSGQISKLDVLTVASKSMQRR